MRQWCRRYGKSDQQNIQTFWHTRDEQKPSSLCTPEWSEKDWPWSWGRSSRGSRADHRTDTARQSVHKKFESYTPLIVGRAQILNAITNEHYLRRPNHITHGLNVDKTKYYFFHKNYGHTRENYHKLKDEIEFHIRRGKLKDYVRQGQLERCQDIRVSGSKSLSKQPITGVIHMIIGATEEWAQSKSKRKQHLRNVITVEGSSKRTKNDEGWQIKFSPLNTNIVQDNDNDPIVVSTIINTFLVEIILIDDGSAVEVLMWKVFKEMGLEESQLKPSGPIYGFANQPIRPKGIITLPITIG